jgi:uncharacterized protein YbbK (DUF523 family)
MNKVSMLVRSIHDKRSKKVVFLSHCILNENTRYLGGACRACCVAEIVERCMQSDLAMVQMPCPEQQAWGGILKRLLLLTYGASGSFLYRSRRVLLPFAMFYTRLVYRRLARELAAQIQDYLASGFSVAAIVGIDGSPTCGVRTTLDLRRSFDALAYLDLDARPITAEDGRRVVSDCLIPGRGLFTVELQKALKRRRIVVPYLAHDLIGEAEGKQSAVADRLQRKTKQACDQGVSANPTIVSEQDRHYGSEGSVRIRC